MRRIVLLAAVAAAVLVPARAEASPYVRYGIQDDAWLEFGPGTLESRLDRLDTTGVDLVRVTLDWSTIERTRGKSELVAFGCAPPRSARPRHRAGRDAVRNAALGERRSRLQLGAEERLDVGELRPPDRAALSVRPPLARLERAEPAALAPPDHPAGLRAEAPQPRIRGAPQRAPERARRRRRHRSARLDRRRVTRRLDRRDARRGSPARRVRAQPVRAPARRDAVDRRLRALRDDHDGDARAAAHERLARVGPEANLADGVRLPDEPARPLPRRLEGDAGALSSPRPRSARTRRRASTCSSST